MPKERNSVKVDFAMTLNDDVGDFLIRMVNNKLSDMGFEKEYYETELKIAEDQKKVNLSNGKKYSGLYKEKLDRLSVEMKNFEIAIETIRTTKFVNKKFNSNSGRTNVR